MTASFLAAIPPIAQLESLMSWALIHIHDVIGSWSWSIVALTIIVRILLVPLTVRQIHSMQNLQAHAPEMKALQQKYKSDRKRQNEELMKFYRENNINPAASCLPLVAQIPVFISLFYVLKGFEKEILPQHGAAGLAVARASSTSPRTRRPPGGRCSSSSTSSAS